MNRRKAVVYGAVLCGAAVVAGASAASAQSFQSYRCTDGTRFIAAFYDHDSRAYLQIGGRAVTLARSLSLSGARYAGNGILFRITKAGITVKQARRPGTACELAG
jgi:membrane-bound inhibitor of C-type lysozyme